MFSVMCVCSQGLNVPMTHDILDLTVQTPPHPEPHTPWTSDHQTRDPGPMPPTYIM